jgi:hypothetical protein
MKSVEIICTNCGEDAFLQREAIYEGFSKTGEKWSCSACGFVFASEDDLPLKACAPEPVIFTEADRAKKVELFDKGENQNLCRYCAHYLINPFTQFCSRHKKEVQATDTCNAFEPRQEKSSTAPNLFI